MDRKQTELLQSIQENLSGELAKDLPLLMKYISSYSTYDGYEEFIYALGKIGESYLEEEYKQDFRLNIEVYAFDYFTKLDSIEHLINRRQYDFAHQGLMRIIEHLEQRNLPLTQKEYGNHRCFTDELQLHLYKNAYNVQDVLNIPIPYDLIYLYLGATYSHTNKYEEALIACNKGIDFDPVSSDLYFLKASILKQLNRTQEYYEALKQSFYFACTKDAMARYYLALAHIAFDDQKSCIAHYMCLRSLTYAKSADAFDLLDDTCDDEIAADDITNYYRLKDFPLYPNRLVIDTAQRLGDEYLQSGNQEAADEYYNTILNIMDPKRERKQA